MSTGSHFFVREASAADNETVARHRQLSAEEAAKFRGSLHSAFRYQPSVIVVAGYGTTVMGSASVAVSNADAFITHLYVEESAREVGIGDALITYMIALLRSYKVSQVKAQALPGDRATKNLFERHGLIAETIIVGKSL